ncbi:MAG: hypothetical protein PHV20_02260 [Bacteroidales bacterium]|nr:hypothetical protein [Bacteroidales bacterium]
MPETAKLLGAFVRWILKGCKTDFKNEIEGNFDAKWGGTYEFENFIVGAVTSTIILGFCIWLFFS